jgi:methionine synthase II (cobalamin-independent)
MPLGFLAEPMNLFFLEYDSERAGTFEPLKAVPAHKSIVRGLVSTKTAELETEERRVARVHDCARYVSLDRLGISPQCGFSSSDKSNKIMSIERATEKLALVADVARKVWGD